MLGEQIKKLRTARGLTQTELAHRIGVSKQSISNWENNNILPAIDVLVKVAEYFHCSTDYLLELNTGRLFIETTDLTEQQFIHVLQIVQDYEIINQKLKKYTDSTNIQDKKQAKE